MTELRFDNDVRINIPTSYADLTLGQWIDYQNTRDKELDIGLRFEDLEIDKESYPDQDFTQEEAELNILLLDLYIEQLCILCGEGSKEALLSLPSDKLPMLLSIITVEEDVKEISSTFQLPEAMEQDIKEAVTELQELPFYRLIQRGEYKKRIHNLKQGFVLLPVGDLVFGSRIATDKYRKNLAEMPEKLKIALEESGQNLGQFYDQLLAPSEVGTPEEEKEKTVLSRMIKKYALDMEQGKWNGALGIISHVSTPAGMKYDSNKAERRKEHFRKLPLDTAMGILNFFTKALKVWTALMAKSSSQ